MTTATALSGFALAAALLTITPGLDTVLVIRTRLAAGVGAGVAAAAGVAAGCLVWGLGVALGLGVVFRAAPLVYDALRFGGALYLLVTGVRLIRSPRNRLDLGETPTGRTPYRASFARGLLTNVLNPKVGLFYLSFLPQFVPAGMPAGPFMAGLSLFHAMLGFAWLASLSGCLGVLEPVLLRRRTLRWLDRLSGGVFIGFGLRLAVDRV